MSCAKSIAAAQCDLYKTGQTELTLSVLQLNGIQKLHVYTHIVLQSLTEKQVNK